MTSSPYDIAAQLAGLRLKVGTEMGVTAPERFSQSQVNEYAVLTGEDLWVHTDPVRAASSHFGGTIVQATLLIARFGAWIRQTGPWLPEPAGVLNYGYDRVRIPGSLLIGASVRGRVFLSSLEHRTPEMIQARVAITAERDDGKVVIAADWIMVFVLP